LSDREIINRRNYRNLRLDYCVLVGLEFWNFKCMCTFWCTLCTWISFPEKNRFWLFIPYGCQNQSG